MSIPALVLLGSFMRAEYPRFLEYVDKHTYGGEDVTVAFALKKAQGVSVINCGAFHQHRPEQYIFYAMDSVSWPSSSTPISFHHFRSALSLKKFFWCTMYWPKSKTPRCFSRAAEAFVRSRMSSCDTREPRNASVQPCDVIAAPSVAHEDVKQKVTDYMVVYKSRLKEMQSQKGGTLNGSSHMPAQVELEALDESRRRASKPASRGR